MPRRKKQEDEETQVEGKMEEESETEEEEVVDDDEVDNADAEYEDPIEGEEEDDEVDSEEQAMTVAQSLLMKKKQAVMSQADVYRTYYAKEKQTQPYITKFEKAKIVSVRAQAIESGATPFVPIDNPTEDPYSIAQREYEAQKIPYFIVRVLPDGEKEYWRLSDFTSLVPLTSM